MKRYTSYSKQVPCVWQKYTWFVALCILVLCGCSSEHQEDYADAPKVATVTLRIEDSQLTRATSWTNPDISDMTITILLCQNGKIVSKQTKTGCDFSASKKQTLEVTVNPDVCYDICVWADLGQGYYTISDYGNAPMMTIVDNVDKGTDNKGDGYHGHTLHTFSTGENVNLSLVRPFALMSIYTNNWDAVTQPATYSMTYTAHTQLDLITGQVSTPEARTLVGTISASPVEANLKELSFDYILAPTTNTTMQNFKIDYYTTASPIPSSSYTFSGIRIQRNYKTNVTGSILQ